ncbi:hypothetical protein [Paucibacter sp. KCTC 42545]|uniref:hypothetical protein n=1 Tax=Paucibacter sp. KCTC 42545 TaxID=1768242 RepID=UPI000733B9BE|nr:hypothetical protein [Paucibacter sp. KCTC 42545]ALT76931.1 hypothetical protein AT984_06755 [Paucibacter sp. KCTC 42545]
MNLPTPAIVAERGAQRMPRLALILFCAAYVLPGLFGREPWRNADLSAFGFMSSVASGHAPWWQPSIAGIHADGGPLPYWVGAMAIKAMPMLEPALAARLPYGLILVLVLMLVWYSCFHLARTEAAQPVAFAFGGEAQGVDYARAMADGALLALIASLGLLQLGHETTPELLQLLASSLFLYGLAAAPFRLAKARWAVMLSLPVLAASGAPAVALACAVVGAVQCSKSSYAQVRELALWILIAGMLAAISAWEFNAWAWRVNIEAAPATILDFLSLSAWFSWPAWPLALWTLWRWRAHWQHRHIFAPLSLALIAMLTSLLMDNSDRALLLGLPALAVLAAFALPTLKRGFAAAMDWFSVFFFSAGALFFWIYYLSMQLDWPKTPAANLRRLADGFEPQFNALALTAALLASAAWVALVRWRTARNQHALWKSLVLPAGGVALCWLLAMTILLPFADYARSDKALIARLGRHLPPAINCLAAPDQSMATLAAIEFHGGWLVDAKRPLSESACDYAVQAAGAAVPANWVLVAHEQRPTDRKPTFKIWKRALP